MSFFTARAMSCISKVPATVLYVWRVLVSIYLADGLFGDPRQLPQCHPVALDNLTLMSGEQLRLRPELWPYYLQLPGLQKYYFTSEDFPELFCFLCPLRGWLSYQLNLWVCLFFLPYRLLLYVSWSSVIECIHIKDCYIFLMTWLFYHDVLSLFKAGNTPCSEVCFV